MTFKTLAEFFQKLETTTSRNSMVLILADLFKQSSPLEIGKIAYLTQGRVAPLYEPVEFGMAEKMVLKAIALAFKTDLDKVTLAYKSNGDIGSVAGELSVGRHASHNSNVNEVFEKLVEITKSGGEGSVEKKINLLADILSSTDSVSAKFIARIPVDKLRLGFSDMTVLEGLSWMMDGTKKNKPVIEAAYNIRPDLGFIAESVKKSGVGGVKKVEPKVGTPILVMRAERSTSTTEILERTEGHAAVEPKLDGLRTQVHVKSSGEVRLYSRGLENVTSMYPDLLEAIKKELKGVSEVILDGEAIGFDPKTGKFLPFQETTQRKRKYDIDEISKSIPVQLVTFDILYLNGRSFINEPYKHRRKELEKLLSGNKIIVPAGMHEATDSEELEKYFQESMKKGLEGIMAKKLDGVYQAGARGWNWIKLKGSYTEKLNDTIDAVVMGIDFGQGKRNSFGVGAFLIGVFDSKSDSFKTVSKVGTGLTDKEWKELASKSEKLKTPEKPKNYDVNKLMNVDVWFKPELVGEFRADELTKSPMHTAGLALRFPRLVRWREKKPEDTTTVSELVKMTSGRG